MFFTDEELRKMAKDFVEKSLRIGRKPNPALEIVRKKYPRLATKLLKRKVYSKFSFDENEEKIIEKLKDPDYGPLIVEWKNKYYIKTTVGHTIRLLYSDTDKECKKFVQYVKEECWKRGAHVIDIPTNTFDSRKHLELIPFDTAAELPEASKMMARAYDFRIFIGGDEDINWTHGFEEKVKLGAPARQKIRDILDRYKVNWCLFGWPVMRKKEQLFVSPKKYKKVFFEAIKETFSPTVKKLCEHYKKLLQDVEEIRITANDGTDMSLSIKGRKIKVADGIMSEEDVKNGDNGLNIPDGEVYFAPVEDSGNGYIKFDYTTIHGFGFIKDLEVKFENGKIVWFNAPGKGKKIFQRFLDANTGDKDKLAEFAIGTNPKAQFIGETIVDEKIFGTIHIAIGNNSGPGFGGKNKASSHQDMIKVMKGKNGNVYADGKLIMKNGMPVGFKFPKSK
ncbi:MAG: aminopeptidase [Candidatus Aenigmarchaeota archaeon]|nr:aminopeptidase [Candidatus Aenigmarchaeota archaeon]